MDQQFEVLLSPQDYQKLKAFETRHAQAERQLAKTKAHLQDKQKMIDLQQIQLFSKDQQIKYLSGLFEYLQKSVEGEQFRLEDMKIAESVYELLKESSFLKPEDTIDKDKLAKEIFDRHATERDIVENVIKKKEALEYLAEEVQKSNHQKEERLVNASKGFFEQISKARGLKIQNFDQLFLNLDQVNIGALKIKALEGQIIAMKSQMESQQKNVTLLKKENESLENAINHYHDKLSKVQSELRVKEQLLKAPNSNNSSPSRSLFNSIKGSKGDVIKSMLEEFVFETESSLGKIEGVNANDVKQMVNAELKTITDYIHKLTK